LSFICCCCPWSSFTWLLAYTAGALILLPVDILLFVLSLGVIWLAIGAIGRIRTQLPAEREPVGA